MSKSSIAVLGAGSWGTAVAIHLAQSGHSVQLWGRSSQQIERLNAERKNERYLPGVQLPPLLTATADLNPCLAAEHLIIAVPSHAFKALLAHLPDTLKSLSWLTKGIDPSNHAFLSQLVAERFGESFPMAVISGPSFAGEVARGLPTALVIASNQYVFAQEIRDYFNHKTIRTYLSLDLVGVQLCGAIKNVLAIACGVSDGLMYGANAKAALITRGLAEMSRLGTAFGGRQETFTGLAGVGDLVLTCTDNQSRNRRFGVLLGQGVSIESAEQQINQVVEGKTNAKQICMLASQNALELPICNIVHKLVEGHITAPAAAEYLMNRPLSD